MRFVLEGVKQLLTMLMMVWGGVAGQVELSVVFVIVCWGISTTRGRTFWLVSRRVTGGSLLYCPRRQGVPCGCLGAPSLVGGRDRLANHWLFWLLSYRLSLSGGRWSRG